MEREVAFVKRKGSKRAAGPRHGLVDVAGAPLLAVEADLLRRVLLLRTARRSAGHTQAHEGALETAFVRARGDARGDARTQAQASSSAAASSSSTAAPHQHGVPSLALSDVVAAGRAALAGAAAEVQACVPQPWSYAYIRRAALVHSHSTGNPRKGAHRRRPSEFVVTNAMREQSARNLFDSETLGLQREAFYTQRQLAMHSLRDRAQARID